MFLADIIGCKWLHGAWGGRSERDGEGIVTTKSATFKPDATSQAAPPQWRLRRRA